MKMLIVCMCDSGTIYELLEDTGDVGLALGVVAGTRDGDLSAR
jgi:hypothetical protein